MKTPTGWYRKVFSCEKQQDYRYEIYFEGVYMDTTVYLNGQVLGEWKYGYSSFFFDMTPLLQEGDNELLVRVNYQAQQPLVFWCRYLSEMYICENSQSAILSQTACISLQ